MADEPFYSPNRKPPPPRQPQPGEFLFEFTRDDGAIYRCELRSHAEELGIPAAVEAQFLLDGELLIARRFDTKKLAMQWVEEQRKYIEKGGE
jgi:hypothetical protein